MKKVLYFLALLGLLRTLCVASCCAYDPEWVFSSEVLFGERPCLDGKVGYMELTYFSPIPDCSSLGFVEARGYFHEHKRHGASIGVGIRDDICLCHCPMMLGANVYYDNKHASPGTFQQIGFGVEMFTRKFDFRGNVYIPVGDKVHKKKEVIYDDYIGDYISKCQEVERVAKGADFEFGRRFCLCPPIEAYLALGGYWIDYHDCCGSTTGFQGRLKVDLSSVVYAEGRLTHDHVTDTKAEARIGIRFSLCNLCDLLRCQYQPIERSYFICTKRCCTYENNF